MKYLPVILVVLFASSCSPRLNYLGDVYPATTNVDTYYSIDDIRRDFKVIGQLNGSNESGLNSLDGVKKAMIKEAKKRGADAIVFLFAESYGLNHRVRADFIKYLD